MRNIEKKAGPGMFLGVKKTVRRAPCSVPSCVGVSRLLPVLRVRRWFLASEKRVGNGLIGMGG